MCANNQVIGERTADTRRSRASSVARKGIKAAKEKASHVIDQTESAEEHDEDTSMEQSMVYVSESNTNVTDESCIRVKFVAKPEVAMTALVV